MVFASKDKKDKSVIHSLQDYRALIEEYQNKHNKILQASDCRLVFRGTYEKAHTQRYLVPSIVRAQLVKYEREIIKELQRLKPFDFVSLSNKGIIEKSQHYRLPTRLLDFTLSPYIALWFAVANDVYDTTRTPFVYCVIAREQDAVAESIARIPFAMKSSDFYYSGQPKKDFNYVEDILFSYLDENKRKTRLESFLRNIYDKENKNRVVFTYPVVYTERERNQQSIFAIFQNKIYDTLYNKYLDNFDDSDKVLAGHENITRFVFTDELDINIELNHSNPLPSNMEEIEISNKQTDIENMIEELDRIGINEAFLFPDSIEHTSRQVVKWAKKKFKIENKYKEDLV